MTHRKLWQPTCDVPDPSDRRTHSLCYDAPKHIDSPQTNPANRVTPVDPDHYNRSEQSPSVHPNHPRFHFRALNDSIGRDDEMERIVAEAQATIGRQHIIRALRDNAATRLSHRHVFQRRRRRRAAARPTTCPGQRQDSMRPLLDNSHTTTPPYTLCARLKASELSAPYWTRWTSFGNKPQSHYHGHVETWPTSS
ncbi:hypothetical protein PENNAL_c0024G11186 [Penicillium nalgiovense]|uniref:Uncharacterized protein n=1 Tax=Penicillium nalgiovense TaxID=60175 RepID=A0A1V6YDN3_PENNA|nr:hypothetical protein PENNAL_c0024G11186 [Penicillium nalgiovense]